MTTSTAAPATATPETRPAPVDDEPVVDNDTFMENVREALSKGFDRLCAHCGVGVYDDSDIHERACPEYDAERAR
jgi:hypothetical protein